DGEEIFLNALGDGAARAVADLDAVDRANGRDFRGRAGEKNLVRDVEHFAGNDLLDERDAQVVANRHHGIARDAWQRGAGNRRRQDRAVHHEENIFAGAFADVAVRIEGDAFDVAVGGGFHADELRVHVVRGGLGHLRQRVRRGTIPGADADVHATLQALVAEIASPFPAREIRFDRSVFRIDAAGAITAQNNRTQITRRHFVDADQFEVGFAELVDREGNFHAIDVGGIEKALHVFAIAENRGALWRAVTADSLEDGGAVADDVSEDVNLRIVPIDELAVVPNLIGFGEGQGHVVAPRRTEVRIESVTRNKL